MPRLFKDDKEKEETEKTFNLTVEEKPKLKPTSKKKGIVSIITKGYIYLDVNGNGERIPFDPAKHATLQKGDIIDF